MPILGDANSIIYLREMEAKIMELQTSLGWLNGSLSTDLHFWLPDIISSRLREAFKKFDRKMHGFLTNDAIVVGVESRSSSAVRIPRNPETGQHPVIKGLFPAGEGSGYSGGITSSAIDGENAAVEVAKQLK